MYQEDLLDHFIHCIIRRIEPYCKQSTRVSIINQFVRIRYFIAFFFHFHILRNRNQSEILNKNIHIYSYSTNMKIVKSTRAAYKKRKITHRYTIK